MTPKKRIQWLEQQTKFTQSQKKKAISILTNLQEQEKMPKEEISELAKKIRPLLRKKTNTGKRQMALFWADAPYVANKSFMQQGGIAVKRAKGLKKVGRIVSYHDYNGYYGAFSPKIREAITQCPKEWLDKVTAFEIEVRNLNPTEAYSNLLDRHVLHITYYTGDVPEDIANRPVEW